MFTFDTLKEIFGLTVVVAPTLLFAVLALTSIAGWTVPERTTARFSAYSISVGLLAAIAMLILMLVHGREHVTVNLGNWIELPPDYNYSVKLLFDYLSLSFVILSLILCGTIGAFADRYMHREPGFNRFFTLYAMFATGMVISAVAGTIETLFTGWELVGLSSALLIAFFQERVMPVRNGLHVWSIYRVADAAFLAAAIALHHMQGHGDFDALLGTGLGRGDIPQITSNQALIVGLLLLFAAAGKSGLVPFSGWLPRAMEGPTPSSAVFYGALSVHLGAFMLLRVSPILALSTTLGAIIVVVGLLTALFGALTARAQTDIKSALSFASVTQVGLIVAEIGLGLHWIALIHLIGHACLRTLQFVRAPTLLQDYRAIENAIGSRLPRPSDAIVGFTPRPARSWLYRLALERGYLDGWLTDYVVRPSLRVFRTCDRWERRWTDFLSGGQSRESDQLPPSAGSLEEIV